MTAILVVCTGNVCRSPIAEGLLKDALQRRFADKVPSVESAGTAGWERSGAMPASVDAARELGIDISGHRGRRLRVEMVREADLVICMAGEHRELVVEQVPDVAGRTFTLKELVRLLEALPPAPTGAPTWTLAPRVAGAHALRQAGSGVRHHDEDIADPLGQPIDAYRAVAWELGEWIRRLEEGLFGPTTGTVAGGAETRAAKD
jgi:low molecular weight protein-tyrosine phosphatase